MCCDRCGVALIEPTGCLRLSGEPLSGDRGPRVVPAVVCADCASLLQRWLAEPSGRPVELVPVPRLDVRA